jgi:adenine-specific DNA-methyltransferase
LPSRNIDLVHNGYNTGKNVPLEVSGSALKEITSYEKKDLGDKDSFNRLILGDNLTVLKSLMLDPSVKGKVRLIYIDPPFSTGQNFRIGTSRSSTISSSKSDEVAYSDDLSGVTYLEFLRARLLLMREILAEDGSIYVHVDCRVGHYVKVLMDELFGAEHFINEIARVKCNPKNFPRRAYGNVKDMVLFYSKTKDYVWNDPREPFTNDDLRILFPKTDQNGKRYTTNPLHAPGETLGGLTGQHWRGIPPPRGRHWRYPPESLEDLDRRGLIEWSSKGVPRKKIFADEFLKKGKKRQDIWEFKDPQFPSYPTEKNMEMLKMIIEASSHPGDLVLDAFCGSGTTLVAADQLRRKWLGIDNSPLSVRTAVKRLKKTCGNVSFKLFRAVSQDDVKLFETDLSC